MCVGSAHNEQRCVPWSQLSYGQLRSSKAGSIKPVLVKLANQVQQKDAPIKESEGPIIIDNIDPPANDHDAQSSISTPKNFQPTWCPSGLSRTQKHKLQRAHCKKFKEEGLTKMGRQIFSKDPIAPQSSKREPAACSK
jgi:hypothetical protein